jgi:type II secretory pathway pseudopilin PulG
MNGIEMNAQRTGTRRRRRGTVGGYTLIELLIAAFLLLIVFYGLAQVYARGRRQVDYEEDRRKATAVSQARLDGIRRDFSYDSLPTLDSTTTTVVVDNRTYSISHAVAAGTPEEEATTITLTVHWNARTDEGFVERSAECTTILARGMPWGP